MIFEESSVNDAIKYVQNSDIFKEFKRINPQNGYGPMDETIIDVLINKDFIFAKAKPSASFCKGYISFDELDSFYKSAMSPNNLIFEGLKKQNIASFSEAQSLGDYDFEKIINKDTKNEYQEIICSHIKAGNEFCDPIKAREWEIKTRGDVRRIIDNHWYDYRESYIPAIILSHKEGAATFPKRIRSKVLELVKQVYNSYPPKDNPGFNLQSESRHFWRTLQLLEILEIIKRDKPEEIPNKIDVTWLKPKFYDLRNDLENFFARQETINTQPALIEAQVH